MSRDCSSRNAAWSSFGPQVRLSSRLLIASSHSDTAFTLRARHSLVDVKVHAPATATMSSCRRSARARACVGGESVVTATHCGRRAHIFPSPPSSESSRMSRDCSSRNSTWSSSGPQVRLSSRLLASATSALTTTLVLFIFEAFGRSVAASSGGESPPSSSSSSLVLVMGLKARPVCWESAARVRRGGRGARGRGAS